MIKSFPSDGLHRSSSEIDKKDRAKSRSYGASAEWSPSDYLSLGLLFYYENFNLPIYSENNSEQQRIFRTISISYRSWTEQFVISGETAFRSNSQITINTLNIKLDRYIKLAASIRYFTAGPQSLYSNNYSTQTDRKYGESGISAGLFIKTIFGKFDILFENFSFPEGSEYSSLSSSGRNTVLNYSLSGKSFTLSCRLKSGRINDQENAYLSFNNRNTFSIKSVLEYKLSKMLQLKSGFEYRNITDDIENDQGYYFFSGLSIRTSEKTDVKCRGIYYSSSFNTRLTEYENDLDGLTGIAIQCGRGFRYYILSRIRIGSNISVQAKYSFQVEDADQETINPSRSSAISLQAEVRF
jgi:hypothetical protein